VVIAARVAVNTALMDTIKRPVFDKPDTKKTI
jgi:hypothetical protein